MKRPRLRRQSETSASLWLIENSAAITEANAWIENNGLPLRTQRLF